MCIRDRVSTQSTGRSEQAEMSADRTIQQQKRVLDQQQRIKENLHRGVDTLEDAENRSEDLVGFSTSFQQKSTESREETDPCCSCCFGKKDKFDGEAVVAQKHRNEDSGVHNQRSSPAARNVVATH
eukprot:TRINITY_DN14556_c0_g1_i1.p1 TRINITY_DN14556_c0_g1~~TRINITY_DN14556_c0_g1_i1.p1  ORF type:complete len:126 (-),score=32.03 TRINITY_DN14556_c0_g1_i1:361-738(-)